MTITLNLQPETAEGLLAQATAGGLSLLDFVNEIVVREAHIAAEPARQRTGQEFVDACSKARGLLTD